MARSGICLLTVILVSNTTPFSVVLRVLRRILVPALLITTLALRYRYLFVLGQETQRMSRLAPVAPSLPAGAGNGR